MENKFLEYLCRNKFLPSDYVSGMKSHIADKEKEEKALFIDRLTSDEIGAKIAVVYNSYTKERYICLPGESTVTLPNGYKIVISNDERGEVEATLYNPEGKGKPACSYRLSDYLFSFTRIEENGVEIGDLGKVLEPDTWALDEDYLK